MFNEVTTIARINLTKRKKEFYQKINSNVKFLIFMNITEVPTTDLYKVSFFNIFFFRYK